MNKICFGCGSKLQSENTELPGYIPLAKIKESVYCQRCFKIMHYGMEFTSSTPKDISLIVKTINKDNRFVIFLVDFLSINEKVMEIFNSIKQKKLLLISKGDIIPKTIKESMIKAFLVSYYHINSDIKIISSYHNHGVQALTNYLERNRIREAYIVGLSNAGKSTLVNKIIAINESKLNQITTSNLPNTTLDFIRIKINNNLLIIDSPGFIIPTVNNSLSINRKDLKGSIKPRVYQMKAGETLRIEDMYLNFSENTNITLYMANNLKINKYFKEIDFKHQTLIINNMDLIISGLGFINIKNQCLIKVLNIDPGLMEVRESIFGEIHE